VLVTVTAAGAFSLVLLAAPSDAQMVPSADAQASVSGLGAAAEDEAIRPFQINSPEGALAEIPGPPVANLSPPLFVPGPINNRLWPISFNRVDKVPEQLVRGREDIFFRLRVRHPDRERAEAARRRGPLLRPSPRQPRRPARLLRVVSPVGRHPRIERAAHDPAADDARPGDRRSGKLG